LTIDIDKIDTVPVGKRSHGIPAIGTAWQGEELQTLLNGTWIVAPEEGWKAQDIAISVDKSDLLGDNSLFIAIDEETCLEVPEDETRTLELELDAVHESPALHDQDGWIDFGPAGSSYYYSWTRMTAGGEPAVE
jgi:hypothetical protein